MKSIYFSAIVVSILVLIASSNLPKQHDPQIQTFTIATYNVRNAKGMDNQVDFDRVANVINSMNADAIAIQELDSATERSNGVIVLDELAKRTNMIATFNASIEYNGGKYGIGILTKEPPLKKEAITLPGREEKRSLLIVEMENFVLCCTHLSLNDEDRTASIKQIQQETEKYTTKPVFLAGDLNAKPYNKEIKTLLTDWIILSDSTQATYPSRNPTQIIDYIFMKSNNKFSQIIKKAEVIDASLASDHLPVRVEVEIR